jgi:hypothetical protein
LRDEFFHGFRDGRFATIGFTRGYNPLARWGRRRDPDRAAGRLCELEMEESKERGGAAGHSAGGFRAESV